MPVFTINTNIPADKIPADFCQKTSKLVASALGKPESYVCVCVKAGLPMTFGGSSEPCASCEIRSIGAVGRDYNRSHASKLYPHLSQTLGLAGNRVYIEFIDVSASTMAFNGSTFA
ncbi:unnamed protein product [Enterobius vermicularis]|uniref:L-dopachrome isomerase n=1 Tax=Enterobius vermicularis TaxID=51028 RepID=A0A0N4VNM1_ENTVE|nr:unnamed protein product [Enterobius vermicularis]